jgi:hypothetical protein
VPDFDDFAAKQQVNYQQTRVKQVLAALIDNSFKRMAHLRNAGEALGFGWFNDAFPDCPVTLEARKVREPVQLARSYRASTSKTELWKAYYETRDNWPDRLVGLIFDRHGDMVSDLVVHNATWLVDDTKPVFEIPAEGDTFFVQELKWFLEKLKIKYTPE